MTDTAIASVDAIEFRASRKSIWTFVEIRSRDGRVGTGEATVSHSQERMMKLLADMGRELMAASDPFAFLAAIADYDDIVDVTARCALDNALHDINAQRAGVPLWKRFASSARPAVPMYANINRRTFDRTAQGFANSVQDAVAANMQAVKIAPFDGVKPSMTPAEAKPVLQEGFDRMAAVRAAIGPDRKLLVDCHWRLNPEMIPSVLEAAQAVNLYWLECPYVEEAPYWEGIKKVRSLCNARGILTAGAELKATLVGYKPMLDFELYDVLMPDMKHIGGYDAYFAVAEAAKKKKMWIAPHNPSGPICHAHSVHACAATENFLILEMQFDESAAFTGIVDGALPMPEAGVIVPSNAPGLGLKLVRERLTKFEKQP